MTMTDSLFLEYTVTNSENIKKKKIKKINKSKLYQKAF